MSGPELEGPGIYVADLNQMKAAIDKLKPYVKQLSKQLDSYRRNAQHVEFEFGKLPLDETRKVNSGYAELVVDGVKYMTSYVGGLTEFLMALELAYVQYLALDGQA